MTAKPIKTLPPTRPNAGTAAWYRRKLDDAIGDMQRSLVWWITAQYRAGGFAMDEKDSSGHRDETAGSIGAAGTQRLVDEIERLRAHWLRHFDDLSDSLARMFARKTLAGSDYSSKTAFKELGLTVKPVMTEAMRQAYQGVIGEQVGLIRSIAEQHLTQVQTLVMQSVQRGRDLGWLTRQLQASYGLARRRAALIARDQNNKASATLSAARNLGLGITQGVWKHSHAGKTPRPEHVEADGEVFDLKRGLRLEGEWVLPGQAINCRCFYRPVLPDYLQF